MSNCAIYPGSFDPFTNGHLDIVKKSSRIFGKVIIVISINKNKKRSYDIELMKSAIEKTLAKCSLLNCEVCIYDGLVAEFAKQNGVTHMIRGLRNNMDYNYEENIAEVNKLINPELEYVYFRADSVGISSSMVKELISYGRDVSKYLPDSVMKIIK